MSQIGAALDAEIELAERELADIHFVSQCRECGAENVWIRGRALGISGIRPDAVKILGCDCAAKAAQAQELAAEKAASEKYRAEQAARDAVPVERRMSAFGVTGLTEEQARALATVPAIAEVSRDGALKDHAVWCVVCHATGEKREAACLAIRDAGYVPVSL